MLTLSIETCVFNELLKYDVTRWAIKVCIGLRFKTKPNNKISNSALIIVFDKNFNIGFRTNRFATNILLNRCLNGK